MFGSLLSCLDNFAHDWSTLVISGSNCDICEHRNAVVFCIITSCNVKIRLFLTELKKIIPILLKNWKSMTLSGAWNIGQYWPKTIKQKVTVPYYKMGILWCNNLLPRRKIGIAQKLVFYIEFDQILDLLDDCPATTNTSHDLVFFGMNWYSSGRLSILQNTCLFFCSKKLVFCIDMTEFWSSLTIVQPQLTLPINW
jgi:hypothetical protein